MDNLVWGPRHTQGKTTTMDVTCGEEQLAQFLFDTSTKPATQKMTVDNQDITLEFSGTGGAKAVLPNGSSFSAHPNKRSFARSNEIMLDLGRQSLRLVNEASSDWVVEDSDGTKLGQFSGANHGVRHVVVEMEPEAQLGLAEAAFLAWVARLTLEEKLVSSTWILTLVLALITPFIVWFFLV